LVTIKQIRQELGWTRIKMAHELKICIGRYLELEDRQEEMNSEEIVRLALITGKKPDTIATK